MKKKTWLSIMISHLNPAELGWFQESAAEHQRSLANNWLRIEFLQTFEWCELMFLSRRSRPPTILKILPTYDYL